MAIKFFSKENNWSISWICKQLEISRAAYYKWLHREVPANELENHNSAEFIKEYDERFNHILGYRRMISWINHFNHTNYKRKRVHRIMKKLYLSAILDLYDRYPVAYVIGTRNDNQLVFKTFDKAIAANPDAKPLFHSNRGFQYTSRVFQRKLEEQRIVQFMSRVGHCIDNGPMEGFLGIIKSEMYQMYDITDEISLRFAIHKYINFYSEERPQDKYHCKTPLEVRNEAMSSKNPTVYPIAENSRIQKYKAKWVA